MDAQQVEPMLRRQGRQALDDGDLDEAERLFTELAAEPGGAADGWYGLGHVALRRGEKGRAAELFAEVTRVAPEHANAWYYRATLDRPGDPVAAREHLEAALRAQPTHRGALQALRALTPATDLSRDGPVSTAGKSTATMPTAAAAAPHLTPPSAPRSWDNLVGIVQRATERTEGRGTGAFSARIYEYVVQPVDRTGAARPVTSFEMRGAGRRGQVDEGDWVEVDRRQFARRHVRSLDNLSTGTKVTVRGVYSSLSGRPLVFLLVPLLPVVGGLLWQLVVHQWVYGTPLVDTQRRIPIVTSAPSVAAAVQEIHDAGFPDVETVTTPFAAPIRPPGAILGTDPEGGTFGDVHQPVTLLVNGTVPVDTGPTGSLPMPTPPNTGAAPVHTAVPPPAPPPIRVVAPPAAPHPPQQVISAPAPPSPATRAPAKTIVPDVVGARSRDAERLLIAEGFTVQVVGATTTDTSEDGRVLNESPSNGSQVTPSATVTLTVGQLVAATDAPSAEPTSGP